MQKVDPNHKIEPMVTELRSTPEVFLKNHQNESSLLEYKTSFEYDIAMDLCPLIKKKDKKNLLNPCLSYIIFKTLVAFANTHGGLLIMGVAESKGEIVGEKEKKYCTAKKLRKNNGENPCFESSQKCPYFKICDLKILGIDRELSVLGWDFDQLRRHILERFSLITGKSKKKELKFKPAVYPCMYQAGGKISKPLLRVSMSESLDQYIDEIFPVTVTGLQSDTYTLGAVSVRPSDTPIYLTIEESDSQNVLYALPVRKTGKTELEKDLVRVQNYISKRFGATLAEQIAKELNLISQQFKPGKIEAVSADKAPELVEKYAAEWKTVGYAYHMVETYGKDIRNFTKNEALWKKEKRPDVLAFLLMVSLHYNAGWETWTPKNSKNEVAVKALFTSLHTNYWRTRFRALYALQFMDQATVMAERRKKRHRSLSAKTFEILKENVPTRTAVKVIKETARNEMGAISRKAQEVLMEIATLWNDCEAGMEAPL
jgi:hypothetical protein